jgi:hypothetical protein
MIKLIEKIKINKRFLKNNINKYLINFYTTDEQVHIDFIKIEHNTCIKNNKIIIQNKINFFIKNYNINNYLNISLTQNFYKYDYYFISDNFNEEIINEIIVLIQV